MGEEAKRFAPGRGTMCELIAGGTPTLREVRIYSHARTYRASVNNSG